MTLHETCHLYSFVMNSIFAVFAVVAEPSCFVMIGRQFVEVCWILTQSFEVEIEC